jgi:hypothetical protein
MEAVVQIVRYAAERQPGLFEALRKGRPGASRPLVGKTREEVYPRGIQTASYTREIAPGWFIRTDISNEQKRLEVMHVCRAAGLEYGREIEIHCVRAAGTGTRRQG